MPTVAIGRPSNRSRTMGRHQRGVGMEARVLVAVVVAWGLGLDRTTALETATAGEAEIGEATAAAVAAVAAVGTAVERGADGEEIEITNEYRVRSLRKEGEQLIPYQLMCVKSEADHVFLCFSLPSNTGVDTGINATSATTSRSII
jgi:hypothetical protein